MSTNSKFQGAGRLLTRFPFDFDGGTQGADLAEVSAMAADWLKLEIEFRLMDGRDIPEATFGHERRMRTVASCS